MSFSHCHALSTKLHLIHLQPRPKYVTQITNPCYMEDTKPGANSGSKVHCLPYFHILGNDKCGTTDFHARLTQHPRVLPNNGGLGKEIYYWCWLRYGEDRAHALLPLVVTLVSSSQVSSSSF